MRIFIIAIIHLIFFAFAFFRSLYFTFPGEPGYNHTQAVISDFFSHWILPVVGFPILFIVNYFVHSLKFLTDGWAGDGLP